jgi:alanyl-tRNA synthetase
LEKMREIEKELAAVRSAQALASAAGLLGKAESVGGLSVLFTQVDANINGDDLRTMALDLRNRLTDSVIGLLSVNTDRVTLVVASSDGARSAGVKAGALVKIGSAILGGGGGGKDDFAQGGGVDAGKIGEAISQMKVELSAALGK